MRLPLKMANSRPRGKGITLIGTSAIGLDELLEFYHERGVDVWWREKRFWCFFPAKNLRNAPREVVMCKYGLQIKTWSFCMCICISAQQNRVFRQKKSVNSHFSAKKDGAKPDTVFCKRHRSKKITALEMVLIHRKPPHFNFKKIWDKKTFNVTSCRATIFVTK